MWGSIKGRKRCAVVCQGYYEWLKKGKDRLPHFTKHKDGQLMLLAGMYDCVTLEGRLFQTHYVNFLSRTNFVNLGQTEPLWTFTIVTTDSNKELSWLHDRMPVVLSTKAELEQWLDCSSQTWSAELSKIILPYNNRKRPLDCYAVPTDIGKVGAESPTFIEPIAQRKDGIQAMFAKQANSQKAKPPASPILEAKEAINLAKRKRDSPGMKRDSSIEILDGPPEEKRRRSSAHDDDEEAKPSSADKTESIQSPASSSSKVSDGCKRRTCAYV